MMILNNSMKKKCSNCKVKLIYGKVDIMKRVEFETLTALPLVDCVEVEKKYIVCPVCGEILYI